MHSPLQAIKHFAARNLPVLVNNLVDHPVFLGLLGIHDVVALDILFDALHRLPAVLGEQRIDRRAHAQNFFRVQINVCRLTTQPEHPWLVNQDPRVRQGKPFFRGAAGQQHRRNGGRLSDTGRHHVGLHELHGVVNRESRRDRSAWRVNVQLNVFFGIFRLQKEHLRRRKIGDMVIDRRPDKNNVFFQAPRINIVSAFPAAGLFHHYRYEGCSAILWFFEIFHSDKCRWHWAGVFHFASAAAFAAATVLILAFCASQSSVLSLRSLTFILSSIPCFVKRARIASADSPLCPATCSSSCASSSSVMSMLSFVAMRSIINSAFTSSLARSSCRFRSVTQSTFTARGSTPCAASDRTTRSSRTSI